MKTLLPLLATALLCAACASPTAAPVVIQPSVTAVSATETPAPTETRLPTEIPVPTATPTPQRPAINAENAGHVVQLGEINSPSLRKVVFAPDGSTFATTSGNQADFGTQIWKSPGGTLQWTFGGYSGIVWDAAFSPDGQWLATAADDPNGQRLRIWNMSIGSQHAALDGPRIASSTAFSPDGKQLAVGGVEKGTNGTIWIYDTASWLPVQTLSAPGQNVTAVVFSRDSKKLISGGTDGKIRVWSLADGNEAVRVSAGKQANRLALSPDGRLLASNFCDQTNASGCTKGGVAVWRTADWTILQQFEDLAESVTFSADGSLMITGSGQNDPVVRIRRAADWILMQNLPGTAYSTAISPDSRLLVTTGFDQIYLWGMPKSAAAAPEQESSSAALPAGIKTTMGDFEIASARLVDEVHGQTAPSGEKFLLVILTGPNGKRLAPGEFALVGFQKMVQDSSGGITVSGKNGEARVTNMAGWVEDEFAAGFVVPVSESYTLTWPGNDPVTLYPTTP